MHRGLVSKGEIMPAKAGLALSWQGTPRTGMACNVVRLGPDGIGPVRLGLTWKGLDRRGEHPGMVSIGTEGTGREGPGMASTVAAQAKASTGVEWSGVVRRGKQRGKLSTGLVRWGVVGKGEQRGLVRSGSASLGRAGIVSARYAPWRAVLRCCMEGFGKVRLDVASTLVR